MLGVLVTCRPTEAQASVRERTLGMDLTKGAMATHRTATEVSEPPAGTSDWDARHLSNEETPLGT
jgi:hypothetical protein